jgi:tetratricopeptide (TPR) repeat protein
MKRVYFIISLSLTLVAGGFAFVYVSAQNAISVRQTIDPRAVEKMVGSNHPTTYDASTVNSGAVNLNAVKLTARFDRDQYFLGENVLVSFVLENTGSKPLKIDTGSDYRFAPRSMRFRVKAIGPDGKLCEDPFPDATCEGGLGGTTVLQKGERFTESVPIMRYCRIDSPGKYKITVSHDFGWKLPEQRIPLATAEVTFVMPSAEQARTVVERMCKVEKDPSARLSPDFQDFHTLRYAVYLPILKEMVKNESASAAKEASGNPGAAMPKEGYKALDGIGEIATPEATATLIEFGQSTNPTLALKAMQTLNLRLPDPMWQGKIGGRSPFENPMNNERQRLNRLTWRPEFETAARKIGRSFLERSDVAGLQCGAFIMECIGKNEDLNALEGALDGSIAQTREMKKEQCYPRPRGATGELMRAATLMIQRGAEAPRDPHSYGQCALFLTAIGESSSFRPAGWQETCKRLLQHEIAYIREQALLTLPQPYDSSEKSLILKLVQDKDEDVQIAASNAISKEADPLYKDAVLAMMRESTETIHLSTAINTAEKLGLHFEVLKVIADRLDQPVPDKSIGLSAELLSILVQGTIQIPPNSSEICQSSDFARTKPHWLKLLQDKEKVFRSGGRLSMDDPAISRALFPPDFHIQLPNGRNWPENNDSAQSVLSAAEFDLSSAEGNFNRDMDSCKTHILAAIKKIQSAPSHEGFESTMEAAQWTTKGFEPHATVKVAAHANDLFVRALILWADYYFTTGDYAQSRVLYGQSIMRRTTKEPSKGEFTVASKPVPAAQVVQCLEETIASSGNDYTGLPPQIVKDVIMLAQDCDFLKKYDEADVLFKAALPHFKFVDYRHMSAEASNSPKIEAAYNKVLTAAHEALSPQDPRLATRYELMARFYQNERHLEKAEPLYDKAISIRKAQHPSESSKADLTMLAFDIENLKECLEQQKKADSQNLDSQLIELKKKLHGPADPDVARLLEQQANRAINDGKRAEAARIYKEVWEIRQSSPVIKGLGRNCIYLLSEMTKLADTASDALDLIPRVNQMRQNRADLDSSYSQFVEDVEELARKLDVFGKTQEAEKLLQQEIAFQEQTGRTSSFNTIPLLHRLAAIYEQHGNLAGAEEQLRKVFKIAEDSPSKLIQTTGLYLPDPMTSLYRLLMREKRYEEAQSLIERSVALEQQSNHNNGHPSPWTLRDLASCIAAQGDTDRAREKLKQAGEIEHGAHEPVQKAAVTAGVKHPKLVVYLDLVGSPGFNYRLDISDDGSRVTAYDVVRNKDFEDYKYHARLEFERGLYCERKALDAKEKGDRKLYSAMHERAEEAITNTIRELQKHLPVATDANDVNYWQRSQLAEPYMNLAICYALIHKTDECMTSLNKYVSACCPPVREAATAGAPSADPFQFVYPGYYFTVATIMLAEGDLDQAKTLLQSNLKRPTDKPNRRDSDNDSGLRLTSWLMLVEIAKLQGDKIQAIVAAEQARKLAGTLSPRGIESAKDDINLQMQLSYDDLIATK